MIIGIGRTYGSFRELPQSYAEASQALEQATLLGDSYAHIDDLEEAPLGARYQTLLPKLVGYAQVGKADRAEELLARIWKLAEGDLESKKLQALKILDTVTAVENSPQRNLALRLTNQKEVTGCADSQEIYLFLRRFLRQQVEALSQRRKWRNKSLMDRALAFIEENYANAITLDEVAEHVNLSPAYFSSVFKQELGKSFVEALNSFRIEQSKKLLADPLLNVSEVGYKVGFNDQSYFTRVFKKITGVTPTQWREHN